MNSNSKMSDDLKAKFIVLKKEIDKVDDTNSLITLKNQLSDLKNETLITGQAGKSFGDIFKNAMSKLSNLRIKEKIISQIKDSIEELRGIDTILTDIGKTSNYTKNQLKQLGDSSFETASTYGKKHLIIYLRYRKWLIPAIPEIREKIWPNSLFLHKQPETCLPKQQTTIY